VLAQAAERVQLYASSARLLAAVSLAWQGFRLAALGWQAEYEAAVARVRAELDDSAAPAAQTLANAALSSDAAAEFGLAVAEEVQQLLAPATDTATPSA
jgi:hypothetical protein